MYTLKHYLGNTIHVGTKAECELIANAFKTYGISEDRFEIVLS